MLATEGEQLAGEGSGSFSSFDDVRGGVVQIAIGSRPALDERAITDDDVEQIVEIVGDSAGELADGFHLLRVAKLLGCAVVFDDLAGERDVGRREFDGALVYFLFEFLAGALQFVFDMVAFGEITGAAHDEFFAAGTDVQDLLGSYEMSDASGIGELFVIIDFEAGVEDLLVDMPERRLRILKIRRSLTCR